MKLRIGQIKVLPEKGKVRDNFYLLMEILQTQKEPFDVVITPECFLDGYIATEKEVTGKDLFSYALDTKNSPYVEEITKSVKRKNCWLILGCIRLQKKKVYNSALVFNRSGNLVGWYDKIYCQTHDRKFSPGNRLPVFSSDFGSFGVMICADRRWPETVRCLALKGARIIFNPSFGMHDERNLTMMRTRSYESEIFIVFTHPRQSLITGPEGEVITNEKHKSRKLVVTEINLDRVDKVRSGECSHLRDLRKDVYQW